MSTVTLGTPEMMEQTKWQYGEPSVRKWGKTQMVSRPQKRETEPIKEKYEGELEYGNVNKNARTRSEQKRG